jgi:hypothetical protein
MLGIEVATQGDGAWPDIQKDRRRVVEVTDGTLGIVGLEGAAPGGRLAVALRVDLPNGYTVVAVTSARLLCAAADALRARYEGAL